jgi:hypothetical protein
MYFSVNFNILNIILAVPDSLRYTVLAEKEVS